MVDLIRVLFIFKVSIVFSRLPYIDRFHMRL